LLDADVRDPRFDADGVHDIHRMIRKVLDQYPARVTVGEIWVSDDAAFARYLRPDELHLGFNFRLLEADFNAEQVREATEHSLMAVQGSPAPATWTMSNHEAVRPATRYGGGEVGLARARAMALVLLALPGPVYLYNGDELGLPNVELPDWTPQDPVWRRSGFTVRGATAAECRCRGKASPRHTGSARHPAPGCRCRETGPNIPWKHSWRALIRCCRCAGERWNYGRQTRYSAARSWSGMARHHVVSRSGAKAAA